jgi:CO/xanthine dehydrogenase Mo-binding subunit
VTVEAGAALDEVVLRSYCIGATHQAVGWVRSEAVAVDTDGDVRDLTLRSFGILGAGDMPPVSVRIGEGDGPPVNGSDAVFAAVAAATWLADGLVARWPTGRGAHGQPVSPPGAPPVG